MSDRQRPELDSIARVRVSDGTTTYARRRLVFPGAALTDDSVNEQVTVGITNFWEYDTSGHFLQPDPAAVPGITEIFTVSLASSGTILDIQDTGAGTPAVNTAITLNSRLNINSTASQDWNLQGQRDVNIQASGGVSSRDVNINAIRNTTVNGRASLALTAGASSLNARVLLYPTNDVVITAPTSAPASGDLVTDGSVYGSLAFYLDEAGNNLKVKVKYHDGTIKTGTVALT